MSKFKPITKEFVKKRIDELTKENNAKRRKLARQYREDAKQDIDQFGDAVDKEWLLNRAAECEKPEKLSLPVRYYSRLHEFDQYFRIGCHREIRMREEAVRKGFSKVFVHLYEKEEEIQDTPRRASLSLVSGGAQ